MNEFLQSLGLQGDVLFAGFAGGAVRAITKGYTTVLQVITAPLTGALCAGYLTQPILHYVEKAGIALPPTDQASTTIGAASFLVGISGMWIVENVITLVEHRIGNKLKGKPDGK